VIWFWPPQVYVCIVTSIVLCVWSYVFGVMCVGCFIDISYFLGKGFSFFFSVLGNKLNSKMLYVHFNLRTCID